MRKFLFLLLIAPLAAQTNPSIYGNAWQANSLANLEIGLQSGRLIDLRFQAETTDTLSSVTTFLKTGPPISGGYGHGTGGTVLMQLETDDGTASHNPGSVLDSVSVTPGNISTNIASTSSNWSTCFLPSCNPGGSGTPITFGQTFGASSVISITGPAFSNGLAIYKHTGTTTNTYLQSDFTANISSTNAQAYEYDMFIFKSGTEYMFGEQCDFAGGFWDVWNQSSGVWVPTTLACSLTASADHHIQVSDHICGTSMCYDSIIIDGVNTNLNLSEPSGPTGFSDAYGIQFQLDENGTGTSLSETLKSVNFVTFPQQAFLQTFSFPGTDHLSTGTLYHLVLSNTDASPTTNFLSLDDLGNTNLTSAPYYAGNAQTNCSTAACFQNFAELWQDTAPPWAVKTNHIPIISVNYTGGVHQGQNYTDALAISQLFNVQGANQAGQTFNPTVNRAVNSVGVWVQKVGSPSGPLTVALQTAAGGAIDSVSIPAGSVSTTFTWLTGLFPTPHSLTSGSNYRVVLSAPSDASNYYQVFPMQTGGSLGMPTVTSQFTEGNYQTNTGSGWTNVNGHTDYAMSLFLGDPVFVSQSGGSVSCGADGTQSTTAIGSVTWTGGNTYKLCGTLTSAIAPTTNNLTIIFETGANVSPAVCPATGCLNLVNRTGITVDGGVDCGADVANKASCNGTIQATANGTGLANQVQNTIGVDVDGSSGITLQNLLIGPIYLRTSTSDSSTPGQPLPSGIWGNSATNLLVKNTTIHDANWNQSFVSGTASSGLTWTNVDIYNSDHCWAIGVVSQTTTNIQIDHSHCHDGANWDHPGTNDHHHDGLHLYTTTGSGKVTNVRTYDNTFDGNWGTFNTAAIFEEGPGGGEVDNTVYNNLFDQSGFLFNWNNGFINTGNLAGSNPSTNNFYNNTLIAGSSQAAYEAQITFAGTVENNVFVTTNSTGATLWLSNHTGTVDYNTYATPTNNQWSTNGGSTRTSFATWQSNGNDTHAPVGTPGTAPFHLSATGVPDSSFIGIGAGLNLTSLSIPTLNSDQTGHARPSTGPWTIGILNFQSQTGNTTGSVLLKGVLFK